MNGVQDAGGLRVAPGEQWRKLYGPYLIYTSTGATAAANHAAAQQRTLAEKAAWPYAWLTGNPDYPLAAGRGTLTGQLVVQDALKPAVTGQNAWLGVTQLSNPAQQWQLEEKNYQYWVKTDAQGNFTLPGVRPGTYALFARTDVQPAKRGGNGRHHHPPGHRDVGRAAHQRPPALGNRGAQSPGRRV